MGRLIFSRWSRVTLLGAVALASGCAVVPVPSRTGSTVTGVSPPLSYEPLAVRNGCFVESVHFYDRYFQKQGEGTETGWAQILEWGNQEGDLQILSGHAVTVFVVKERLWYYDVNFGIQPVDVPTGRRADITDVGPKIFAKYPQFSPILARYRYDFAQQPGKQIPTFLFYHANPDVRDATRVASELGRVRPVRVCEFDLKPGDKTQTSAAAVFIFGRRVCLYFPRQGTFESPKFIGAVDDLRYIGQIVRRLYPGAGNVRWQPGGYLLFPNEKKSAGLARRLLDAGAPAK